jgi:hypothetical protein
MAKIIWLASYPKSGNTWIRALLVNYLQNSLKPADINRLTDLIASSRTLFDEWAGVESSSLDNAVIERLRPGVYRCMARELNKTNYVKVHDAWGLTDQGGGVFPADITGGVIYILRNPLDMAASLANHYDTSIEEAVDHLCDPGFALSKRKDEPSRQLMQKMGTWSDHVGSWLDRSGLPVHLVRYEDLKRDPDCFFGEVVRFCGLPWDEERVKRAVAFSDFSELRGQEQSNDFCERLSQTPFFRKGQVGSWREELPAHLVQRLIDVHGETMRRFGYLDENNQPV